MADSISLDVLRGAKRDEIQRIAGIHGARSIRIFGSVARGEAQPDSDLDLLVEWDRGRSLLDHVGLVQDLEDLLGVRVQIGTEKSLDPRILTRVLAEATRL